jgi:DNA-directed RNA polymerase specialized sigma24 family protein
MRTWLLRIATNACLDALARRARGYVPTALDILTFDGDRIAAVTAFRGSDVFARFGLPDRLDG